MCVCVCLHMCVCVSTDFPGANSRGVLVRTGGLGCWVLANAWHWSAPAICGYQTVISALCDGLCLGSGECVDVFIWCVCVYSICMYVCLCMHVPVCIHV